MTAEAERYVVANAVVNNSQSRMADSTLRFSDVAHFVGLSLLKDPKPAKGKTKASLKGKILVMKPADSQSQSQSTGKLISPKSGAEHYGGGSGPAMQQARSLPSLRKAEQPRPPSKPLAQPQQSPQASPQEQPRQLIQSSQPFMPLQTWQPVQHPDYPGPRQPLPQGPQQVLPSMPSQQDTQGKKVKPDPTPQSKDGDSVKMLEQTLAERKRVEGQARQRTEKTRERRNYHQRRLQSVEDTISRLETELQAGEQAALQAERQKEQLAARLQYQMLNATQQAPSTLAVQLPSIAQESQLPDESPALEDQARELVVTSTTDDDRATGMITADSTPAHGGVLTRQQSEESGVGQGGGSSASNAAGQQTELRKGNSSSASSANGGELKEVSGDFKGAEDSPSSHAASFAMGRAPSKGGSSSGHAKQPGALKNTDGTFITPDISMFDSEKELLRYRQEAIRRELIKNAGTPLEAFKAINLNGSGNICSQEFGDGVKRLGVAWQLVTGLSKPRQLFKIFDLEKTGVITFFELFPTERNKPRDDSGMSTPDFWKAWVNRNRNMENGCGGPKWHSTGYEDDLRLQDKWTDQDAESHLQHKWIKTTFRRMKFKGKSDARCREMVALHLPRGSGPEDLHGVKTFSTSDVIKCKQGYIDDVSTNQRSIEKALDDLRKQRRVIHNARLQLYTVSAMEEKEKKEAQKCSIAGLSFHNKHHDDEHLKLEETALGVEHHSTEQLSFKQLSVASDMPVKGIEDVFRVWMRHSDKTETILKKQFLQLLEELCPKRCLVENDVNAWWDQIHNKSYAECMKVDWTAADDRYSQWRKASLGADGRRGLAQARKTPATFDQFIFWYCTSEVRP